MASELSEYVRANPPEGFRSRPYYSQEGDFLSVFFYDDDHFAERVDSVLTVYYSMEGRHKLVGCKVKGVRRILETLQHFNVVHTVQDGDAKVKIRILFLPGMALANDSQQREVYENVDKATGDLSVDASEFQLV